MTGQTAQPSIWTAGGYELAEGTRWLGDRLVFTDILCGRLFAAPGEAPGDAKLLAGLDVPLGAVAPVAGRPGEWIAAAGTGIAIIAADGTLGWIGRPEDGAPAAMRMNDGCCDPAGRFWAGSMSYDAVEGAGSLYRVDADCTVTKVLDGMTIVNGPAFAPDGSLMYVSDTHIGVIYACTIDPRAGEITGRRVFAEIPASEGAPDGMTVDAAGGLWVALWDGACVRRYRPDGSADATIALPAQRPTCVCLGGPGRDRLFISTARYAMQEPSPADGAILSARVGAHAPSAASFVRRFP